MENKKKKRKKVGKRAAQEPSFGPITTYPCASAHWSIGADTRASPVGLSPAPTTQLSAIYARAVIWGHASATSPSPNLWHVGPTAQGVTYLAKMARPGRVSRGSWPAVDRALTIYDPPFPRASPSPQPTAPSPEESRSGVVENSSLREKGVSHHRRTWVCATGRAPPRAPNYLKSFPELWRGDLRRGGDLGAQEFLAVVEACRGAAPLRGQRHLCSTPR
jgi:hypothetical protein